MEQTVEKRQGTTDKDILAIYLRDINKTPLLTPTEETDLIRADRKGDKDARGRILKANLRFVVKIAKRYQNRGLPLEDLISEGNVGLIKAFERFDVDRGFRFISYAVWWIRQSIFKAVYEKSRMIRLPLNRVNELVQIEKVRKTLGWVQSETEEMQKIGEALNMEANHVRKLLAISQEYVSVDVPANKDVDSSLLGDLIEDDNARLPEDTTINNSLKTDIDTVLSALDERESEVIKLRYGLNDEHPRSLNEIGDLFGLTKERIRQIERKAMKCLRDRTRTRRLFAYMT